MTARLGLAFAIALVAAVYVHSLLSHATETLSAAMQVERVG